MGHNINTLSFMARKHFKNKKGYTSLIAVAISLLFIASCSSNKQSLNPDYKSVISKSSAELEFVDTSMFSRLTTDYVISAANLTQQGRYAEAILDYFEALKYDSSASIYYLIAKNYRELYRYNSAIEFANYSLKIDSLFIPAMKLLGDIYIMQFKTEDAVAIYNQIIQINPSTENRITLARLYEFFNPAKAAEIYEDILKDGNDYTVLVRLAAVYEALKNEEKLLATFLRLDKAMPNNSRTLSALTELYYNQKNYSKALEQIDKISKNVSSPELDNALNTLAGRFGDDTSAIGKEFIGKFLGYIDNRFYYDWKLQTISAYLNYRISNFEISDKIIKHVLDITDTISDVPLQLSSVYTSGKEFTKAIKLLEKYQPKFPKDFRYPLYISSFYMSAGDYNSSLELLKQAQTIEPNNFEIYAQYGITYDRIGLADSSDAMYSRALKINPNNALVNNNFAYSLSVRGIKLEEAINMSSIALKAEPYNPSYLDTYGWIQYRLGNYDLALEYLNKALTLGGSSAEVLEHLGEIYLKKGNSEKAKSVWNDALKMYPENQTLIMKLKELE